MPVKCLTLKDRRAIARMYEGNVRVLDIAVKIGCHPSTIYDELHRGDTGELDEQQRPRYDPDLAQRNVQASIRRRGNRKPRANGSEGQPVRRDC